LKQNAAKQFTKLVTSLNSECVQPSSILIHQQNLYAPCSKRHICHHEAQSCEPVNKGKNLPEDSQVVLMSKSSSNITRDANLFELLT
jgi:hypothetical protein